MALINQNSIIGVTSITSPSASNVLTVHTNDTTERLRVSTSGVSFSGTNASLDTSGNATFNGNVSIGGTLTYEDVTNIDAVGVVTARAGVNISGGNLQVGGTTVINSGRALYNLEEIKLADTKELVLGSGNDLKIHHSGSHSFISQEGVGALKIKGDDIRFETAGGTSFVNTTSAGQITVGGAVFNYQGTSKPYNNNAGTLWGTANIALTGQWSSINWPSDHSDPEPSQPWYMMGRPHGSTDKWTLGIRPGSSNSIYDIIECDNDSNGYISNLKFHTSNGQERFRITSSGEVNVGGSDLTSTAYAFQVSRDLGTPSASGTSIARFRNANSTYSQDLYLSFNNSKDIMWAGGSGNGGMTWNMGTRGYVWQIGGSEKVRISNVGQLTTTGNNQGNPVGIEIRNNNTNAYSHAELKLTSQNATTSKIWCDVPNSGMRLNYNGGSSVKIDQSGNLHMPNGAGIDFSATANSSGSMGSELLDDYEEGSWTPSIDNLTNTPTYDNLSGRYTRIGRVVHLMGFIQINGTTTPTYSNESSAWSVSGLPYARSSTGACGYVAARGIIHGQNFQYNGSFNDYGTTGVVNIGFISTTALGLYVTGSGNGTIRGQVRRSSMKNTFIIEFDIVYNA